MKLLLGLTLSFFSTIAVCHGSKSVAELPKACYTTVDNTEFCTTDNLGNVQVFIYNAGWCGPCNTEMGELALQHKQFEGKKVTFASLSGEGFKKSAKPDKTFLDAWKSKHKIPFVVAGAYKDFGKVFGPSGSIPFAVIVDTKGNVVKKGYIDATEIVSLVKKELQKEEAVTLSSKEFLEKLRGNYKVVQVGGQAPLEPDHLAEVYWIEELPDMEILHMPYCIEHVGCKDSGNEFVYANTTVTKTEKGYRLELKQAGQVLKYDWEDQGNGMFLYRNHQFELVQGTPIMFEHLLKKQN